MSFSYTELINSLLENRGNQLNAKRGALSQKDKLAQQVAYFEKLFFGDGTNLGLFGLTAPMFDVIRISTGSVSTSPSGMHSLESLTSAWKSKFNSAVSTAGDGAGGLYPPQTSALAVKDFNSDCSWLTTSDMTANKLDTSCILSILERVSTAIGTEATETADNVGPFTTLPLATAYMDSVARTGIGIKGKRTCNLDLVTKTSGSPSVVTYYVGLNGADSPDSYSGTQKSNLENALSEGISQMQNYCDKLNAMKVVCSQANPILAEAQIANPSINIDSLVSDALSMKAALQTMYDYFSPIIGTSSSNRDYFNSKTTEMLSIASSQTTIITGHVSAILGIIGTSSSTGIRNNICFWVRTYLAKPAGPLIAYQGIDTSITDANRAISEVNLSLSKATGVSNYLLKPEMQAVYPDPLMDDKGAILETRLTVMWSGPTCCNKFVVLRKAFALADLTNDAWTSGFESFTVKDVNSTSGLLLQKLRQTLPTGSAFLYRVIGYDASDGILAQLDSPATQTDQSDLLGTSYEVASLFENVLTFASDVSAVFTSGCFVLGSDQVLYEVGTVSEKLVALKVAPSGTLSSIQKVLGYGTL